MSVQKARCWQEGVTVERHSHLYVMKYYGSCGPVTHVVPLVTGHTLCSETTNCTDVTRQETDETTRFLHRICGSFCIFAHSGSFLTRAITLDPLFTVAVYCAVEIKR